MYVASASASRFHSPSEPKGQNKVFASSLSGTFVSLPLAATFYDFTPVFVLLLVSFFAPRLSTLQSPSALSLQGEVGKGRAGLNSRNSCPVFLTDRQTRG